MWEGFFKYIFLIVFYEYRYLKIIEFIENRYYFYEINFDILYKIR